MKKLTSVCITAALQLNAMAPTLAHAAIYLQGAEINANTLTQDAYVAVTYYDSNGEQKLVKGWIDEVGETTFTIRSGALFGKKTIAYENVLSVIMSDESTEPAKQMNEVNRFIRNVKAREIERAKKESKAENHIIQWLNPINAKAPTPPHAATYLEGTEVNANALIRDAYVAVIYYDSNGKQKLEKGWIDAIGETSFTLRRGGIKDKNTIAYDKVVSVIMSEESTVPAKQMNEVNRFIRTMGNTQQAIQWAETVTVMTRGQIDLSKIAKGLYAHVVYTSEDKKKKIAVGKIIDKDSDHLIIQEAKYRSGRYRKIAYSDIDILTVATYQQDIAGWKNAGQAIQKLREKTVTVMSRGQIDPSRIMKGWYAHVVYTSEDKKKKTIAGWILDKDAFRISVRQVIKNRIERIKDRRDRMTTSTIAYDDIDTLIVAKQWRDIESYRESGAKYNTKVRFKAPSVSKRRIVGKLVEVKCQNRSSGWCWRGVDWERSGHSVQSSRIGFYGWLGGTFHIRR